MINKTEFVLQLSTIVGERFVNLDMINEHFKNDFDLNFNFGEDKNNPYRNGDVKLISNTRLLGDLLCVNLMVHKDTKDYIYVSGIEIWLNSEYLKGI